MGRSRRGRPGDVLDAADPGAGDDDDVDVPQDVSGAGGDVVVFLGEDLWAVF